MDPKREKLMNRMGIFYVVSAVVGFVAWAVYCVACSIISGQDFFDGYSEGLRDGENWKGDDEK